LGKIVELTKPMLTRVMNENKVISHGNGSPSFKVKQLNPKKKMENSKANNSPLRRTI
jgi:hypothetical protein